MSKKKVSEIAIEAGITGKELMQILKKLRIQAKSAASTITEEEESKAKKFLEKITIKKKPSKPKKAAGKKKPAAVKKTTKKEKAPAKKAKPKKEEKPEEKPKEKPEEKPEKEKKAPVKKPRTKKVKKKKADAELQTRKEEAGPEAAVPPAEPQEGVAAQAKAEPAPKPRPPKPKRLHLRPRPPVVTVMGHVDHGKTTLLDAIRKTSVAAKEAGAITQHIGAYEVNVTTGKTSGKVVFLDTPGHEAFTAMRARGAGVTDIVVLVVAADDGIMPQTVEAINHANAAGVQIIVAINKIDKDNANPDQTKQQLSNYNLVPEDWGGETICVPVSAIKAQGLDSLLEMILLQAEMMELKADPTVPARGTIIEARLDKGMGPVATVLIEEGVLKVGEYFMIGAPDSETVQASSGRVRALINDRGVRIKEAPPTTPVEVLGFSSIPQVGEILTVVKNKKMTKETRVQESDRAAVDQPRRLTLEDLYVQVKDGEVKELRIILKGDVQGSIEALVKAMEKLSSEEVRLNVIHKGVGEIGETDIMLASASNAIVIGFNVSTTSNAEKLAKYEEVDVRTYRIIYELLDELKKALDGMLPPKLEEVVLGRAEVLNIFKVSKIGTVAGSRVIEGKMARGLKARLVRDGTIIHEGKISSLKRFKDDVKEVEKGFECGMILENFADVKEGDVIQAHAMVEVGKEKE